MKSSESTSSEELVKKGKTNALSGLLYFFVNTITAFIINPILVNYLGSYYFGIWKSIDKFLGFASVANGQGSQALKWTIANHEADDDYAQKKRYVASSIIVWFIFLPILIMIIGLFIYLSPSLIKNIDPSDYTLLYWIVFLLGINLILTPLFDIPASVLVGTNQGNLANNIKTIWLVAAFFITYIIVVSLGYGLKALALSIIAITVLRGVNYLVTCKKRIAWFGYLKPSKSELKTFFAFSSWKLVWAFVSRFLLSSEIIFLSILVGPTSVSKYIFTSYIPVTGILIAAIVTSAFNPGIGRLIGNKEFIKSQKFIANLREFVVSFSILIGAMTLLLNKSFVFLWAGEELFLGSMINMLLVLIMIQLVLIRNEAFLIDLSLNIKTKVLLGIISVIFSSTFAVVGYLYISNSIISIFIGIFLGRLILLFVFPIITNKMIKNSKSLGIPFKVSISAIIILSISYILGDGQTLKNWYELILIGGLEFIVCSIIVYNLLLAQDNKLLIKSKIFKLVGRDENS